jgi:hypothetical protein
VLHKEPSPYTQVEEFCARNDLEPPYAARASAGVPSAGRGLAGRAEDRTGPPEGGIRRVSQDPLQQVASFCLAHDIEDAMCAPLRDRALQFADLPEEEEGE